MTMIYGAGIANRTAVLNAGDHLVLHEAGDPGTFFADIVLARGVFLRLVSHDHIRVGECPWSGPVLARVAMGFEVGETERNSPVVVIWHPLCHCAKIWIGDRRQFLDARHVRQDSESPDPSRQNAARAWLFDQGAQGPRQMLPTLSDEVLAGAQGVPRLLAVRDRLQWLADRASPVRIVLVSEVDQPFTEFLDLFRQHTLSTEVDVEVAETGDKVVARLSRWSGPAPLVILRTISRFTAGQEVADLGGSLELLDAQLPSGQRIRDVAYFLPLDAGDGPYAAEVLTARCGGIFSTSGVAFANLLHRILDLAGVPSMAAR